MSETKQIEIMRDDTSKGIVDAVRLARVDLPKSAIARLQRLERYDLSFITDKFANKEIAVEHIPEQAYMVYKLTGRLDKELAEGLEQDFKKWVALSILYTGQQMAPPSRLVDMYWHLAILHSKEYNDFCRSVLGRYLGHAPTTNETKAEVSSATVTTKARFAQLFGAPSTAKILHENINVNGNDCSGGYCASNCSGSDCQSGCKSDCQASL
jgi:hypothetical protein